MADGGIGEAALLAAAAESAAAAGGTAAATAAAVAAAEAATAGGAALAGTAAAAAPEIAAAAAPTLALAAPEATAALPVAEAVATAGPAEPVFLGATSSEPLLGTAAGGTVTDASLLGPTTAAADAPLATPSGVTVGTEAFGPPESSGLLGNWWNTTSAAEKLSAGGKLLSGVSAASKAATPSTPSSGPKTTIRPGTTGKPQGGEQVLAQIVEGLLKRRDAYQQGQLGGVPVVYRPRGLLG